MICRPRLSLLLSLALIAVTGSTAPGCDRDRAEMNRIWKPAPAQQRQGGAFLKEAAVAPSPTASSGAGAPSGAVPRDERLMFLRLDRLGALGGKIVPGDRVDLLFTLEIEDRTAIVPPQADQAEEPGPPPEQWLTMLGLQNVSVAEVHPEPDGSVSLGVLVSVQEATLLDVVDARSRITVLTRHPTDIEVQPVDRTTLREALADLEVTQLRRETRLEKRAARTGTSPRAGGEQQSRLSLRLTERSGARAVAVPVSLSEGALARFEPGDWVDLIGSFPVGSNGGLAAQPEGAKDHVVITLLQRVEVLDVMPPTAGPSWARVFGQGHGANGEEDRGEALAEQGALVLALTVEEAAMLSLSSMRASRITPLLRAPGDSDVGTVKKTRFTKAVSDLEVIHLRRSVRVRKSRPSRRLPHQPRVQIIAGVGHGGGGATPPPAAPAPQRATLEAQATAEQQDFLSTFGVDVDTGSYTLARRLIRDGERPEVDLVRVEEFVNFFDYPSLPDPTDAHPFSVAMEGAPSPFGDDPQQYLLRVGLQGRTPSPAERQPVHLTFLIDTSGSMEGRDRIGLVKLALKHLVSQLSPADTVAIATYSGGVERILAPTDATQTKRIVASIDGLQTGGGTAMGGGLELAYEMADEGYVSGHTNRVIVLSDGDANIGASSHGEMLRAIQQRVDRGITLSTIGFGKGNYQDETMEQLADRGNGNYYYVDGPDEARRIFGEEMLGTLVVIAEDVKAHVEFNPKLVKSWQLLGYENREVADDDFRDDAVDAGELGAGHQVTALYLVELVPGAASEYVATLRLRYEAPGTEQGKELRRSVMLGSFHRGFFDASDDLVFATAVAAFAEVLRGSDLGQRLGLAQIAAVARRVLPNTEDRRRWDFVTLLEEAAALYGM